jgi:hypothetical protein
MAFATATDMPYFGAMGGQSRRGKVPASYGYKTEDTHATVDTAGYFNELSTILSVGDIIYVAVVTDRGAAAEAIATFGAHIVLSNVSGVVDVSDVTVFTVTDSD